MAGYSGTPLAKKLGIKEGFRVVIVNDPGMARALLEPLPADVDVDHGLTAADVAAGRLLGSAEPVAGRPVDLVWFFTRSRAELAAHVDALAAAIHPAAAAWISWPKKAANKRRASVDSSASGRGDQQAGPTDVTEDVIREVVLPGGDL